jgi:hypothetical protein
MPQMSGGRNNIGTCDREYTGLTRTLVYSLAGAEEVLNVPAENAAALLE